MWLKLSKNKNKVKKKSAFSAIEIAVVVVMGAFIIYITMEPAKRMIASSKCSQEKTSVKDKVNKYSDLIEGSNQYSGVKAVDDDKAFKDCINSEMGLSTVFDSCKTILDSQPSSTSGVYTLTAGHKVYCDMTTDGGGWTLIAAQYESNPAAHDNADQAFKWNEGIQGDYMIDDLGFTVAILDDDTLGTIDAGFTLNTSEIPPHTQTAFGKGSDPTFIGYSDFEYVTTDIPRTPLLNIKDGFNYHIYRDVDFLYAYMDPDGSPLAKAVEPASANSLAYDRTPGRHYSWAFLANGLLIDPEYPGYSMAGGVANTDTIFAWTIWVR